MDLKEYEEFKRSNPHQAAAYEAEGAAQERDRWRGIEAVAKDLGPFHAPLIKAMKADGRCTGQDLAKAALATSKPGDFYANQSIDRLAIQRSANTDWSASEGLRQAFNNNQRMYTEYRVALAKTA